LECADLSPLSLGTIGWRTITARSTSGVGCFSHATLYEEHATAGDLVMKSRTFLLGSGLLLAACLGCGAPDSVFVEYDCFWCKGESEMKCTNCFGTGNTISFESPTLTSSTQVCDECGGTGMMDCPQCKGKGKVSNNPLAPNL
jgi:hypothetical protein